MHLPQARLKYISDLAMTKVVEETCSEIRNEIKSKYAFTPCLLPTNISNNLPLLTYYLMKEDQIILSGPA